MTPSALDDGEPNPFERAQSDLLEHYGTTPTSRFVDLEDPALECHVLELGRGDPVVLLHGGGGMAVPSLSAVRGR